MTEIGIMIEGQEDLTWKRFFRIAAAVEDLGFACLFRSDHLTPLFRSADKNTLALWPSLTALALQTERIRFGPMVCSITFRHPAMVAKMAAAVDRLSNGRLDLGLGAGWHKREHEMFGIDFPPYKTRLEMLDEGALVVKSLWSGKPTTFEGKHYRLSEAENHPGPAQANPTLIMGGKGKLTLKVVAKHATEWNFSYQSLELFREKNQELDNNCRDIRRDPASLRRSIMTPFVIGKDSATIQKRIDGHRATFPGLPDNYADWLKAGFLGGSPMQLVDHIAAFAEAGVERFMLQHNDVDDLKSLELMADQVLPKFG